jgi:hypothetical protein
MVPLSFLDRDRKIVPKSNGFHADMFGRTPNYVMNTEKLIQKMNTES